MRDIVFWLSPVAWWAWGIPLLFVVGVVLSAWGWAVVVRARSPRRRRFGMALTAAGVVQATPSGFLLVLALQGWSAGSSAGIVRSGTYALAGWQRDPIASTGASIDASLVLSEDGTLEGAGASWVGPRRFTCTHDEPRRALRCTAEGRSYEVFLSGSRASLIVPPEWLSFGDVVRRTIGVERVEFRRSADAPSG